MSATIELYVAVIEWGEEVDPTTHVSFDARGLDNRIRAAIEDFYGNDRMTGVWVDEVAEYVNGPGSEIVDFDAWHEVLHEIDGTPWVTRETHTIALTASA